MTEPITDADLNEVVLAPFPGIIPSMEDVQSLAARLRRLGVRAWDANGTLPLKYVLVIKNKEVFNAIGIQPLKTDVGAAKHIYRLIRHFITELEGVAVIGICESWTATHEVAEMAVERPEEESMENMPGRGEALTMGVSIKGRKSELWRATIHRNPDRIEEFQQIRGFSRGALITDWFPEDLDG